MKLTQKKVVTAIILSICVLLITAVYIYKLNSTLSIETGLVLRSGDIKRVPRTQFHLLDESFANILNNSNFSYDNYEASSNKDKSLVYSNYLLNKKYIALDKNQKNYDRAWALIKPHITQTVITDFNGKATFKSIKSGKFYLVGDTMINNSQVIWDYEVNLKSGKNTVTLDQDNAGYIYNPSF